MKMFSGIKNWTNKLEFWLAIITGLSLSIGLAPMVYVVYFAQVGWVPPTMTHTGPLFATYFGGLLDWANFALLCAFPTITLFLARKVRPNSFSRLWFVLPFVQFIWGLINLLLLFWLSA